MKQINNWLLFLIIILSSCNDNFLDVPATLEEIETKSNILNNYPDNPISQLTGIPVHIVMPAGRIDPKEFYFSARWDKGNTILSSIDDNSGRQQFLIEPAPNNTYYMRIVGGGYKNGSIFTVTGNTFNDLGLTFTQPSTTSRTVWSIEEVGDTEEYKISYMLKTNNPYQYKTYLRAWQYGSSHLRFDQTNNELGNWKICPIETFSLESVSYKLEAGDILKTLPSFVDEITVNNFTPIQQSMTANFSRRASESSSFSKTKGLSLNVSLSSGIGVPILAEGKLNVSTTTSSSWTYGKTETQEDGRSYSFPLIVPANSTYKARVTVAMYDATATYLATYKGDTTGKKLILIGKWHGIKAGTITYDIFDKTGRIVKSFSSYQ